MTAREKNQLSHRRFPPGRTFVRILLVLVILVVVMGRPSLYFVRRYYPGIPMSYLILGIVAAAGAAAMIVEFLWRGAQRNSPEDFCAKCGYDLTLNESGVCPECDTVIPGAKEKSPSEPDSPDAH